MNKYELTTSLLYIEYIFFIIYRAIEQNFDNSPLLKCISIHERTKSKTKQNASSRRTAVNLFPANPSPLVQTKLTSERFLSQ